MTVLFQISGPSFQQAFPVDIPDRTRVTSLNEVLALDEVENTRDVTGVDVCLERDLPHLEWWAPFAEKTHDAARDRTPK